MIKKIKRVEFTVTDTEIITIKAAIKPKPIVMITIETKRTDINQVGDGNPLPIFGQRTETIQEEKAEELVKKIIEIVDKELDA